MINIFGTKEETRQAARAAVNCQPAEDEIKKCEDVVHETASIQATVTVAPKVDVGDIQTLCINNPVIRPCSGAPSPTRCCRFMVSQDVCIQIPLTFSADVEAVPSGISCGAPGIGPCGRATSCTYTIGYYKNHPEVTNALIALNGGSIILGSNGSGASFTVTVLNSYDVLSLNTPAPPIPLTHPRSNQYQILYAQLLAAKLNIIRGAVCDAAAAAIAAADAFIATSVSGVGKDGADTVQEPLAAYNEGVAEGCPYHCPSHM